MENVRVIVDAMGSDACPLPEVKGAMAAVKENKNLRVTLVGNKEKIETVLTDSTNIEIVDATEVVDINKEPVMELRTKRDSSMAKGFGLTKQTADSAFVSAGSTGAIVAGGQLLVGRIKGIKRPALAPVIPTKDGRGVVLCDAGATPDAKVEFIYQNAIMANALARVRGVKNPKIGLLNIGAEAKKGTEIYQETYKRLEASEFNFIGNVEARDITSSEADAVVCDGWTGNIALKVMEGTLKTVLSVIKEKLMSTFISKVGALLSKGAFDKVKKVYDYEETGGAILVGLKKPVIKAHGSSSEKSLKNAILLAAKTVEEGLVATIESKL